MKILKITKPKSITPDDINEQFNRLQNDGVNFQNLTKIKNEIINLINNNSVNKNFLDLFPIIGQIDRKKYREFLKRRNKFLQEHQVMDANEFAKLFGNADLENDDLRSKLMKKLKEIHSKYNDGKELNMDSELISGKYNKADFNQGGTGECVLVSSLEILKKTPFFETMIRCSLKRNDGNDGWLLSVPLCNKGGQFKEIKDDEIKYLKKSYFANGRGVISESSLGFNILESIFIKEYFQNIKLNFNELDYDTINKKINGFFMSGNIGDMHLKDGVLDYFLGKDILKSSKDQIYSENMPEDCLKYILELSKTGIIKIGCRTHIPNNYKYPELPISSIPSTRGYKIDIYGEDDDFLYGKDEKGRDCCSPKGCNEWFVGNHQYSIEEYFTKNNEIYIVIINPWFTEKKLTISLKQFKKMIKQIDIVCFNINDIFITNNEDTKDQKK